MLLSSFATASLALWLFVAPATAQEQPISAVPAQLQEGDAGAATEVSEPRVVCRTETLVGSRMPSRVCMTVENQEQRRRDSRDMVRRLDVQNSNRGRITAPGSRSE